MEHLTRAELDAGLPHIEASPSEVGTVALVVRRPAEDEREVLDVGRLDPAFGLEGDNWIDRAGSTDGDGRPLPDSQLNVMNARAVALVAGSVDRWPLAGDQLYLDLDLSIANLPPGTRIRVGTAVIEVTPIPHTGCKKFSARFGLDAWRWVNNETGRALNLRGINAKVVEPGVVSPGDEARRL